MAIVSVDLASRRWTDLGVVVLDRVASADPRGLVQCEIMMWNEPGAVEAEVLAGRLNHLCNIRGIQILMLDGPQAWKSEDNGQPFCRTSERELNTAAKTGLPGTVLPGTYERFVGYCLALYDALERLGWQRLATRETPEEAGLPAKILVESYPYAAWKSLGIAPLPAKRRCRVSHLAEAWEALTTLLPITSSQPPNHDQMQAIVGGLPGLAIEQRSHIGTRIVGQPPRQEGGYWREGFIAVPLPPVAEPETGRLRWMD